jgi:hypothetical protein
VELVEEKVHLSQQRSQQPNWTTVVLTSNLSGRTSKPRRGLKNCINTALFSLLSETNGLSYFHICPNVPSQHFSVFGLITAGGDGIKLRI